MSTAARAVPIKTAKTSKRAPDLTEAERKECVAFPKGGWSRIPNAYFDVLPRKCAGVEYLVIGVILRETWGGHFAIRDAAGGHARGKHPSEDKPAWAPLTAAKIRKQLIMSTEAIEDGLRQAEEHGYIESRISGRVKWYRANPDKFPEGEDREERTVDRKPPATEPEIRTVAPEEELILYPGAQARPIRLTDDLEARFMNHSSIPLVVLPPAASAGYLDFTIEEFLGEKQANDSRTRVDLFSSGSDTRNGEHKANHSRTPVRLSKDASVDKRADTKQCDAPNRNLSGIHPEVMCDFLNRWCGGSLGEVSYEVVRQVIEALGGATIEDLAARLKKRAPQLEYLTWKIIIRLAADCAIEAAKRNARAARPAAPEPELSDEELAELENFGRRQRERFGK